MKLIIQSDDYGITEAVACGIIKGIKEGVIKCTGMFTNMPSSKKAAEMIKECPDVCLGIDINLVAGKPCADPSKVPSLIKENGYFYTSRERRALDEKCEDHDHLSAHLDEVMIEAEAQIEKFIELNGKLPEYLHGHAYSSPTVFKMQDAMMEKYGVGTSRGFMECNQINRGSSSWYTVPFGLEDQIKTDTKDFIIHDKMKILNSEYAAIISHCGYVDAPLFDVSSFTVIRTKDLAAMLSDEVKQWIKDNHIELITYRDLPNHPLKK